MPNELRKFLMFPYDELEELNLNAKEIGLCPRM
jgi:hypothetical protein